MYFNIKNILEQKNWRLEKKIELKVRQIYDQNEDKHIIIDRTEYWHTAQCWI